MVDSGDTNSFVYSEVVQYLNATTVDVPAMRVTLPDGSYVDCSTAIPFYLKLCVNLQQSTFGVFETLHVCCSVFCYILPKLTSDVVLGMDWLHLINSLID